MRGERPRLGEQPNSVRGILTEVEKGAERKHPSEFLGREFIGYW